MSYRNQSDADQARLKSLEDENARLKKEYERSLKTIERLEKRPVQIQYVHPPKPPGNEIPESNDAGCFTATLMTLILLIFAVIAFGILSAFVHCIGVFL